MLKIATLAALVLTASFSSSFAGSESGASIEAIAACTPDVYRLCVEFIPDEVDITNCLKGHKKDLSKACGKIFNSPE